jgi:diguanylate cyclase (GGDEF)-like protein
MKLVSSAASDGHPNQPGNDLTLEQENKLLLARIAELEAIVVCDTLTPLYNRRHFMDILERWIWRAYRYEGEYGLLFIDVDGLKAVNDSHGHGAGDALLIAVAHALQGLVRKSDIVARISGDEFAILLENIPAAQLPSKAKGVAKCIAKLGISYEGTPIKASVSVGHTPVIGGISASALLARADKSMYEVKNAK